MLEEARRLGNPRKIHCNVSLSPPWIQLVEVMQQGGKETIEFIVEDGRLQDPADALATLALNGQKFVPFKLLTPQQKAGVPKNVIRPATPLYTPAPPPASAALANDVDMQNTVA